MFLNFQEIKEVKVQQSLASFPCTEKGQVWYAELFPLLDLWNSYQR